ncbi:uncharacterized protein LOC142624738 [Castanea sativa]|uniref:uncharacterized protein LOC142624738 n=1 Tax=Castanea sativa TaxID=21020 RepID=UPI003F654038
MAEELEELWKKLTFIEDEDVGIVLDSSSTKAAKEVEFGDGRDKKRVIEMCPWSYEKQLVLIQDFEGELTPKEIEIRWAPFWIQIYNLPLKSRTKETRKAIGSSLGLVLDVDVLESGVQWGKCLRVRVRINVKKRFVRGKKITIEGGESRWVSFKYERLPNFCYRCGLLNHALKDCNEGLEHSKEERINVLRYRAWLRGDLIRRSGNEMARYGVRNDAEGSFEKTEVRMVRTPKVSNLPRREMGAGRTHGSEKTTLKVSNPMLGRDDTVSHTPMSEDLREKENLEKEVGKIEGIEASLRSQVQVQSSDQAEPIVGMQWETANFQKVDKVQMGALAPIIKLEAKVGVPTNLGPELGPFAMCYDKKDGRIAAQTKESVGGECDGSGLKKPVGKKPIGPTLSPKKLSSIQGGKWTRLARAAPEGKEKENVVNKGLENHRQVRELSDIVKAKAPKVIFLMEIRKKNSYFERLRCRLKYDNLFIVPRKKLGGGLALLWNNDLNLHVRTFSPWHIDAVVNLGIDDAWRLMGFYRAPKAANREDSWSVLQHLASQFVLPWVFVGDFNEIVKVDEKSGGAVQSEKQMQDFCDCLDFCGLKDLGYSSLPFTWRNRRYDTGLVWVRLDRAVATVEWMLKFPTTRLHHLLGLSSDHKSIWLASDDPHKRFSRAQKPFRFEAMWLNDKRCEGVVHSA